jgi:hypothetical protein
MSTVLPLGVTRATLVKQVHRLEEHRNNLEPRSVEKPEVSNHPHDEGHRTC